jgi:hypothetical protein
MARRSAILVLGACFPLVAVGEDYARLLRALSDVAAVADQKQAYGEMCLRSRIASTPVMFTPERTAMTPLRRERPISYH